MADAHFQFLVVPFLLFFSFCSHTHAHLRVHNQNFVPDYILHVTSQNLSVNCQTRFSTLVNGTSPGPALYLQEGLTTWIRVFNNMTDQNATMHWHGLSQRSAPFSDGSPESSQWPIAPRQFFDYEIRPEQGDAGTYFYHSHVGFQAVSAHGPLIVEKCGRLPYAYAKDITLFLADTYVGTDVQIQNDLLHGPFIDPGDPTALLLNGQSGTSGLGSAYDPSCAPHAIEVHPDTTYRLRFVGGTTMSLVTLGIECHSNLTIIEADGGITQPLETDHLQVGSGQRFSVLVHTKSVQQLQAEGRTSFWIRYENRGRPKKLSGYALLSYNMQGSQPDLPSELPESSPIILPQRVDDWLEYSLEPLDLKSNPFPLASEVTRRIVIDVALIGTRSQAGFTSSFEYAQNGDVWQVTRTRTPYLVSIFKTGEAAIPNLAAAMANDGWDPTTLAWPADIGEVLDIVWQADFDPSGGWNHPFHAHGGHFWDLGGGPGKYNATENEIKLRGYTPAKRDTTILYRYGQNETLSGQVPGWRAWRIRVTNAGVWNLHCHILQHLIMGMQTIWVFGNASQITVRGPEPYVTGYLNYGGSAYGNATYDPLVNHHFPEHAAQSCPG